MIYYKTEAEIELMRESALLVSKTLAHIAGLLKPGITTISLDKVIGEFIRDHQAEPTFLNYKGYPL
jgi:methionyl aminopeptidase